MMNALSTPGADGRLARRLALILCGATVLPGCSNPKYTRAASTGLGAVLGGTVGYFAGGAEGAAIGAGAGALAGWGLGEVIYRRQAELEAQKAASRMRVQEAEKVLEKYRAYNAYLAKYITSAQTVANDISENRYSGEQLAKIRQDTIAEIDKASAGAKESVKAIQTFRGEVEEKQALTADEQERDKLRAQVEKLRKEEEELSQQLDSLTNVRGRVGGA
ncbi:MAG: hypothetical protein JNK85_06695 [Verrucomicrobiales bacterium]|nr:hypothetical protein [Verrucomicrobiales bacterium]